jgi:hypothetical protein
MTTCPARSRFGGVQDLLISSRLGMLGVGWFPMPDESCQLAAEALFVEAESLLGTRPR